MIKLKKVNRYYNRIPAVDNISFEIQKGEIVGLLGHNGAGKTTIMKMMTGFLEPTSGVIEIGGLYMEENALAIKKMIGYLPENCPVYTDMIVFDYLCYAGKLRGVPEDSLKDSVLEAMRLTELESRADRMLSTLSRGYRQRVGVAQAILHNPEILVLDEPTNGLDPSQIKHMRSLLKDLSKEATIIISTHILQEVQAVCDRVIIIKDGKKAMDASLAELQSARRIVLDTNMDTEMAVSLFSGIEGVASAKKIDSFDHGYDVGARYALNLYEAADINISSALAAETVINSGSSLFALFPESRDLETIFGEITVCQEGLVQ